MQTSKKDYGSPELVVYGNVEVLTQGLLQSGPQDSQPQNATVYGFNTTIALGTSGAPTPGVTPRP